MPKAIAQITIRDENDITVSTTAPSSPVTDQLWLDASVTPSVLKKYTGTGWQVVNDYSASINNLDTKINTKARVFSSTPTVPYNVGDLWVQGSTGDIMRCKTARATGSYTASEWEKGSKYTDDSTTTALASRVSTAEASIGTINNTVALKASKTEVTTAVDGIKIGGRNLATDTGLFKNTSNWSVYSTTAKFTMTVIDEPLALSKKAIQYVWTAAGASGGYYKNNTSIMSKLLNGEAYTVSAWVKSSVSSPINFSFEGRSSVNITPVADTWTYFSYTFTENGATNSAIHFYYNASQAIGTTLTIHSLQLEKGNKATDWTPAPEDIDASIAEVYSYISTTSSDQISQQQASLEVTAESILSTVSQTYATLTDMSSEISRLSSSIDQSAKDIDFKFTEERSYSEGVQENLQSFKNTVEKNIKFSSAGITISASDSPFASTFSNTKLSFTQDDNEVAYISSNTMFITDADIGNSLAIGSFNFLPRQNGNLSIVWKEG